MCSRISGYDSTFLLGLVRLSKGDYSKIAEFAERFGGCPMDTINKFVALLGQLGRLQPKAAGAAGAAGKILQGAAGEGKSGLSGEGKEGGAGGPGLSGMSYKDLFTMFDQDRNGNLDFEEFMDVLKYLNLPLSKSKALRIFSEVEKGDGTIGPDECVGIQHPLDLRLASHSIPVV